MSHMPRLRPFSLVLLLCLVVCQVGTAEASCGDYLHRGTRTSPVGAETRPPDVPSPCSDGRCQEAPAQSPAAPDRLRLTSLGDPVMPVVKSQTPIAPHSGQRTGRSQGGTPTAGHPLRIERPPRV